MPHFNQTMDRVIGTLMGLAAGDKIGGPVLMALLHSESLHENITYNQRIPLDGWRLPWGTLGMDSHIRSHKENHRVIWLPYLLLPHSRLPNP